MPRHLAVGNDSSLAYFDEYFQLRDLYFPHVGLENHVLGRHHRIALWSENVFSMLGRGWSISMGYLPDSLVGRVYAKNEGMGIEMDIEVAMHHRKNVLLQRIEIVNAKSYEREIRIFLHRNFALSFTPFGDTVFYHPRLGAIIHYKGNRYMLAKGSLEGKGFNDYACGVAEIKGYKGTYLDAADGLLGKNPIDHGSVDSTIGFYSTFKANERKVLYYWIAMGESLDEVATLSDFVESLGVESLIRETEDYWRRWVKRKPIAFGDLSERAKEMYRRSLLTIKLHTDKNGGIIASGDSSIMDYYISKGDNYSYVWPRDGSLVSRALDRAGYMELTRGFFSFCSKVLSKEGYMMQKYRPDYAVGSTWHPWVKEGKFQLPIQEDETALVIYALWRRHEAYRDYEFVIPLYYSFIKKAADFMVDYRYRETGLPRESYDLWEEKLGINTFTAASVYAGLKAAASFAKEFDDDWRKYEEAAEEVREGIIKYLYDDEVGFIKRIYEEDGEWKKDKTVDISNGYGIFEFGVLRSDDERVEKTMRIAEEKLRTTAGGYARYVGDMYYRMDSSNPGNPWIISTLWMAEYYIAKAKSIEELREAKRLIEWVVHASIESGLLPEQLHPYTKEALSVTPLTWSHAEFVVATTKYGEKYEKLRREG